MATLAHKKLPVDWASLEITDQKWLPMNVKLESIASVIRNLDLRHLNVTDQPALFDVVDESNVVGFVCTSNKEIELDQLDDYSKAWTFIPVRVQNSAPTIQILNLCAVNGKHRDVTYGYMLEKYLRDSSSSKENYALSNSVYAITPVAFSHNFAGRDFPAQNSNQQVMVFAKLSDTIVQIDQNGRLHAFSGSGLSAKEFVDFAKKKLHCQVYTIVEDPFKNVHQKLEAKKTELSRLLEQQKLDKSNAHLDESLSYEDLKELSQLSEQIEDAEAFELLIDDGTRKTHETKSPKPGSSSTNTRVHQIEQQIRDVLKQIEDMKKVFPHIYWPQISDSDLYGSKEYLRFYSHYKKVINASAPELLKAYPFTPIRTPKSALQSSRKRTVSTTSSLNEQPVVANATPKRRRSSRTSNVSKK